CLPPGPRTPETAVKPPCQLPPIKGQDVVTYLRSLLERIVQDSWIFYESQLKWKCVKLERQIRRVGAQGSSTTILGLRPLQAPRSCALNGQALPQREWSCGPRLSRAGGSCGGVSRSPARTLLSTRKDTGVGKSSIVCRFVQDHFDHNISPTIGASFMTKTVPCGNELHKFLIWDTAGQERFHSLAPMYYRGSAAAVIVYDITKQDSFHTLKKWVKELKEHGPENIVMAIAGNKCDLSDIREVPLKDAKEYAESIGAVVVETSAKNAINIEELFQGISRQIPPLDPHENGNNGAIKLGKPPTPASRRCC
uniref:RAB31, member RAS onco family n=1 Tax=Canis lupus familiaris TaxID=9615 RepID=A0A8P0PD16_CANLF